MKGAYFGNGVYVSTRGVLHVEFKRPAVDFGIQAAKSFKESLEEAIAFAERITPALASPLDIAPRRHAPN